MKIITVTGREIDVLNPKEEDIDIEDIAHSLSLICRWGGHTKKHYSVAQHSVLVSMACSKESQLEGLLHDATEAYIGDIVRPIKEKIDIFNQIEDRLARVIAKKYKLEYPWPKDVIENDNAFVGIEYNSTLLKGNEEFDSGIWSQSFSYLMFKTKFEMLKR
jgi:hypothetical protein